MHSITEYYKVKTGSSQAGFVARSRLADLRLPDLKRRRSIKKGRPEGPSLNGIKSLLRVIDYQRAVGWLHRRRHLHHHDGLPDA